MANTPNLSRHNHYVPQGLLDGWSEDGNSVWAYRTLVSRQQVPIWQNRPLRGSASQQDLYTVVRADPGSEEASDTDEVERWFATEFETPGIEACRRLVERGKLSQSDWQAIIRFIALQHLRTPQSYLQTMARWEQTIPEILETTLRQFVSELEETAEGRSWLATTGNRLVPNPFDGLFAVQVEPDASQPGVSIVEATFQMNRRAWLASIRHVLTGVAERLLEHQWRILTPADGEEWPLTDHPSLRVNFKSVDEFDFEGGWGRRGCDIFMPLSPQHLAYAEVGKEGRRRHQLSLTVTRVVQRILAEGAYHWIFATRPLDWIPIVRPRVVDVAAFNAQREWWRRWSNEQARSERSFSRGG